MLERFLDFDYVVWEAWDLIYVEESAAWLLLGCF
jgi:hypothetical protein